MKGFRETLYKIIAGESEPQFIILSEEEENKLCELFAAEINGFCKLYQDFFTCACGIMRSHTPKGIQDQVEPIFFQTLYFRTVGLIGGYLPDTGIMTLPDFEGPAAMYVRENTATMQASVNTAQMLH